MLSSFQQYQFPLPVPELFDKGYIVNKMIFFDLDGTLLDHQLAVKYATALFWQHFSNSLPYSQAEFYDVWNAITERIYASFTSGKVSFLEQRRNTFRLSTLTLRAGLGKG